tara:strand:- start:4429 stop:5574 length:1146 start_codon:yes stop_codon:yes gene_type:complete
MKIKIIRRTQVRIIIFSLLYVLIAFPAHAGADFSRNGSGWIGTMKKVIAGTKELPLNSGLCRDIKHNFIRTELKKIEYEDIFHELISEDQIPEITTLKEKIDSYDCGTHAERIELFKLWVAYDDKWYAKIRSEKEKEAERLEKKWASEITPDNDGNWDGVINGVFLSIPRKYIWFGSRKPDGYQQAMNLQFFYPDMEASPSKNVKDIKGPTNIGGVLKRELRLTLPCFGFEGKTECTALSYQSGFVARYLDCDSYHRLKRDGDVPYHGRWRRQCGYIENGNLDLQPVYDDVGLWRVGDAGYYKGEPEFPDEWFICKKPKDLNDAKTLRKNQCYSAISFSDGIVFDYTYPRYMFWEQRKIRERLKKKIESFIVKITEERKPL